MALVRITRYSLPSCIRAAVKDRIVDVAPGISLKDVPLSVLTCHFTSVSAGLLTAAAANVAGLSATSFWSAGWVVMTGLYCTVKVAAVVVAWPAVLLKWARYWLASRAGCATK